MPYPAAIERLIQELTRLPGIGRRGAERIVTHLMERPEEQSRALADAAARLKGEVGVCSTCGGWCDGDVCELCSNPTLADGPICVVEHPTDRVAFEQAGVFQGRFHILGGVLSPLRGIAPDDLNIGSLEERIRRDGIKELIIATSPTVEGDATALYLARRLAPLGVKAARIGVGLPLGANLGYADPGTLKLALEGRRVIEG